MPSKLELAWAAGFIDGEGSIHIRIDNSRTNPKYTLIVTVTNTHEESIARIKTIFEGCGTTPDIKMRSGNKKKVYRFTSSCNGAYNILKLIAPYVVVKRKQVDLGIEFQLQPYINMGSIGQPPEYYDKQKEYYQKMHELNLTSGGGV